MDFSALALQWLRHLHYLYVPVMFFLMARFHNLFFAVRPSAHAAAKIDQLRHARRLPGPWLPRERLHVSLLSLGRHPVMPLRLIDHVSEVISEEPLTGCQFVFDRWINGRRSAFLNHSERSYGVERLQTQLSNFMIGAGIALTRDQPRPQIVLGYNVITGPAQAIAPLSWVANELVLIDSLYGEGKHLTMARWPLNCGNNEDTPVLPVKKEQGEQLALFV